MTKPFMPLLTTTNWNDEWKELQAYRHAMESKDFWDERAKTFTKKDSPNDYVERFLELAAIQPGETVFDMGCGNGALCIPLAEQGHKVVAADFSEGMLAILQQQIDNKQLKNIFLKRMSWDDAWEEHGVREGMVDVAFASRSIATTDMKDALLRLNKVARRRVCVTLSTGSSPRIDDELFSHLGIKQKLGHDYLYAFAILVNEGIQPEVSYIESSRKATFASKEEAHSRYYDMVLPALASYEEAEKEEVLARLDSWLGEHLIAYEREQEPDHEGATKKRYYLDTLRKMRWAFLSWNT